MYENRPAKMTDPRPGVQGRRTSLATALALLVGAGPLLASPSAGRAERLKSAGPGVPAVTAGPALYDAAPTVAAPVSAVTVYSDRARVTRVGEAEVPPGVRAVRLPDLPGALLLDSLRVSAEGAEVLRVEATPVERPVRAIEGVEPLVAAVEVAQDAIARLDARREAWQTELGFLAAVAPKALPEDEEGGPQAVPVDPGAWGVVRGFLAERRAAALQGLAELATLRRAQVKALEGLQAELARYDDEAFTTVRRVEVVALLSVKRGRPQVSVDYFVAGASWRPAYTVEVVDAGQKVTLRSAAAVRQATGEDWEGVELFLSTARPGRGIEAPELLTWTLGEAKDFLPVPQAEPRDRPPVFPGPAPLATPGDAVRAARLETLRGRIDRALQVPAVVEDDPESAVASGVSLGSVSAVGRGYGAGVGTVSGRVTKPVSVAVMPSAPPPPPLPAPRPAAHELDDLVGSDAPPEPVAEAAPADSYDFESDEVAGDFARPDGDLLSAMSRGPSGSSGHSGIRGGADNLPVFGSKLASNGHSGPRLGLFDEDTAGEAPLADPGLPANLAGGLDYTFRAQTRATVPSGPKTLSVPLSAETFPVETLYAAAPGLLPTAYLKATVKNTRGLPILAGPVDIFVGADYVGTGNLLTTGPGGDLDLPLGADEDLRIERRVLPTTVTEGVFGKEEITRYVTEIDVANDKRRPVRIRLAEQFPIDGFHEEVKVERGKLDPKPIEGPDDTGRMVFELEVPAGQTRTVRFEYRIRRPENWRLKQL